MQHALPVTRAGDFAAWYQAVVDQADLAEESGVRGCMIIRPWGYGVWQRMQEILDRRFRETGHENCYFPLFIPLSYIAREAQHVEGFAKEMAVVTHHRLKMIDGVLKPDPDAKLEEPLIVRPTSETVIGAAFHRWIRSHRDLPLLLNQWANVVRWEMRTRLFLRTTEFLWQEGHTAHATAQEAREETARMLEVYRCFAEDVLAMPVVAGEKPAHERFPGADNTYSIEAMMQDGKALQAGTAHYLGTNFAEAQSIRYQTEAGDLAFAHTTSWGVSTRLVGGVVMTHGDDDGLRLPPIVAPRQVVLIPMLRDKPEDAGVLEFCDALAAQLNQAQAFGEPVRVLVDRKSGRAIDKRWAWIKRGVPVICDIGARDVASGNVTYIRRDQLRNGEKIHSQAVLRQHFVEQISALLGSIHTALHAAAQQRLATNIRTDIDSFEALAAYFKAGDDENSGGADFRGWAKIAWARPERGAALDKVEQQLKSLKLTVRNTPLAQEPISDQRCVFSGEPAREFVLVGRSY
jgi:prolyl-tRNA synthetase